jgi:hypothetical protein
MTFLPALDLAALAYFVVAWIGYAVAVEWRQEHHGSLNARTTPIARCGCGGHCPGRRAWSICASSAASLQAKKPINAAHPTSNDRGMRLLLMTR